MTYKSVIYYSDDNFLLNVERQVNPADPDQTIAVFHLGVNKFNKNVLEQIKIVFEYLKDDIYLEGYDEIYTYTFEEGMLRMLKHFDGHEVMGEVTIGGVEQTVIKWDLEQSAEQLSLAFSA